MKALTTLALFFVGFLVLTSCKDSGLSTTNTKKLDSQLATSVLNQESENVIFQTYTDLNTQAGLLLNAVNELASQQTEANLSAAREQWRKTRVPWEASEAFLFGPVETDGIDPSIDSWPLNKTDLDNVLKSSDNLTKNYVDGLQGTLKGFHTIEYLLFGDNNDKSLSDFTQRQLEYLAACTECLKEATQNLVTQWSPQGNNFVSELKTAGNASNTYLSQKAAIEELATGMESIADEVANGKINDPFTQKDPTIVESQFSLNSKTDFQNNIRSILHIYTGDYNGNDGPGISDIVQQYDQSLDSKFQAEINAAITAIGNIQGDFKDAITQNPSSVSDAQTAVRIVLSTIQNDIKPLISNLQQ